MPRIGKSMKALILAAVFTLHAVVFLLLYTRRPERIHYVLSIVGFLHLAAYYGYRTWAFYNHPSLYLDWVSYLRWSGAVICALGAGPLALRLYSRLRAKVGRRAASTES
ncbi:MAG: hypothetical protein AB1603_06200 [Chloroflexota bacterium]